MTTTLPTATLTARIQLNDAGNPAGKLADAELYFADGPLAGGASSRCPRRTRRRNTNAEGHSPVISGPKNSGGHRLLLVIDDVCL